MIDFLIGLAYVTDAQRREIKAHTVTAAIHFVLLLVIGLLIQSWVLTPMHPVTELFVLGWVGYGAVFTWMNWGRWMDAIFGTYLVTSGDSAVTSVIHSLIRFIIGFFAVEAITGVFLCIVPFYAQPGACGMFFVSLLALVFCWYLGRKNPAWNMIAWVPAVIAVIAVIICACSAIPSLTVPDWLW